MAKTRPFSAAPQPHSPASAARHRLRAVDRDEVVRTGTALGVGDLLPPGATWLPAPPHSVPTLPGRPPMVGYLVLLPAAQAGAQTTAQTGRPATAPLSGSGSEDGTPGTGPVRIDGAERTATVDGRTLDLTYLEFELLAHLVAHPHRVHTRDHLVSTVWGYGHVGDGRTVDVHIARLRRKLGAERRATIRTVRRVGYKHTP
ncbi:winged helix-turn-helix domain-containing protein [Streptomyces hypolithicus]